MSARVRIAPSILSANFATLGDDSSIPAILETLKSKSVDTDRVLKHECIRAAGVLRAKDMPRVTVEIDPTDDRPAMNGSDGVFAAVAVAAWRSRGLPPEWPTERGMHP